MNSLKPLRVFVTIMEHGTLSAAASRLATSQPAASRQLALLEAELGLRLFERLRQRLVPTDEAVAFYREARHVLAAVDEMPDVVERIRRGDALPLRLIAMPKLNRSVVAAAVTRLAGEQPALQLVLESRARIEMEQGLASGRFHLGVGSLPAAAGAFEVTRLCEAPLHLVLPRDGEARFRDGVPELPYIALWQRSPIRQRFAEFLAARGESREPHIEVSTAELAVALVADGLGFTVMDAFGIDPVRAAQVVLVPLPEALAMSYAVFRVPSARRHEANDAFVETLRAVCHEWLSDTGAMSEAR